MNEHVNLVVDINNIVWKSRYTQKLPKLKKQTHVAQLLFLKALEDINTLFKFHKADGVLCAFEGKGNWRKKQYIDYKKRETQDIYYEDVQECIKMLKEFLETHTSIKSASVPGAEADDVIAVACQNKATHIKNVIISSDRDFVQLLVNPNVELYSNKKGEDRETSDPEYDLFIKCIRGDPSDNIYSAYPRVRKTKIEEAFYGDSMCYMNFMESYNKDGTKVGDRYKENSLLIDLRKQPQSIRDSIEKELTTPVTGKYHQGAVMKFAKEHSVTKLGEYVLKGEFTKMFNSQFLIN